MTVPSDGGRRARRGRDLLPAHLRARPRTWSGSASCPLRAELGWPSSRTRRRCPGSCRLAKPAESLVSRSSVVAAPEDTLMVTLGCASWYSLASCSARCLGVRGLAGPPGQRHRRRCVELLRSASASAAAASQHEGERGGDADEGDGSPQGAARVGGLRSHRDSSVRAVTVRFAAAGQPRARLSCRSVQEGCAYRACQRGG